MALQSSGEISLSNVNVELGLAANAGINMNAANVRTLFGVPSGAISMSHGYGKSNIFYLTISSAMSDVDLRALAVNAGWNQDAQLVATISSGVVITATSTVIPAMKVAGTFPRGVSLVNNGTIIGKGGTGGSGSGKNTTDTYWENITEQPLVTAGSSGDAGGIGLQVLTPASVTNSGTIAGGGGGGGGGGGAQWGENRWLEPAAHGGGGGGGAGIGAAGVDNSLADVAVAGGELSGGAGGVGDWIFNSSLDDYTEKGGNGGDGGAPGTQGATGSNGWSFYAGYTQSITTTGGSGGAAGAAVSGNSNITWAATGTRYGAIT
jgi:hypothetical protein